jgi:chromosome segregation ATPase
MTRVKEVKPGSEDIPEYKSPPSRIVHSLRKGYNNQRARLKEYQSDIKFYQIKIRDLQKSRDAWKKEAKDSENAFSSVQKENDKLKMEIERLQEGAEDHKKKHLR